MELPTEITPIKQVDPITLIIYGEPKQGKSAICAELTKQSNALILSLEPNGYDYLSARKIDVDGPKKLNEFITTMKEKGQIYDVLIVDTVTKLDEWSEIVGTYNYMRTSQGKRFNLGKDGKQITHDNPDWESVHSLANGAGYRFSREWFLDTIETLSTLAPKIVLVAHIKDKYVGQVGDDYITATEVDLTGKLKRILPSRVSGIAKFVREKNLGYLSFESNDGSVAGSRAAHLTGKILISESTDGTLKTHWDDIYLSLKK